MIKSIEQQEYPEIMDTRQTSNYLQISPDTLYLYAAKKIIPSFKLGNRLRFRKSVLEAWMDKESHKVIERNK